jgi:general secretion pathway protein D
MSLQGCAGYVAYRDGKEKLAQGDVESGLEQLRLASQQAPDNNDFRRTYLTQRDLRVAPLIKDAEAALDQGQFARARESYALALKLDPGQARAIAAADRIAALERQWRMLDAALAAAQSGRLADAVSTTRQVLSENPTSRRANQQFRQLTRQQADANGLELGLYPKLREAYQRPVSLSFTNANLLQVLESLKQASGLNFLLERDVRQDLRVTISVQNKSVTDVLRLIMATNQLESRVLDENTVLVYPAVPAKMAEYREMVVRSFYLSNGDAAKVAATLRTIAKARDVVVDERLNLLIVRDSVEVIRMAEKLIAAQDIAEPEVMLELEVLEVSVSRLLEMGIRWPDSISAGVQGASGLGQLTLNELRNTSSNLVRLTLNNPVASAQMRGTKGEANLLANPRVRIRNRQSAKILIGERVPVVTTSTTANVGVAQSVNYLDVGLKLDIEPTISLDDEVSMKVALEVSNILETLNLAGVQAYRLGTRNTSTSLRVKDGETNVLAGLIQRDERQSNVGIPGLNELPVLSKLFGSALDSDTKTEIVLLITPRIVRNLEVPGLGIQEFTAGTDAAIGATPIQLRPATGVIPATSNPMSSPQSQQPRQPQQPAPPPVQPPAQPPAFTPPPIVPSAPSSP